MKGGIDLRKDTTSVKRRWIFLGALSLGVIFLGLGYAWLVRNGLGIPCLFNRITGLQCPGCGISRAFSALFIGRFDQFVEYNLLAPVIALYLLWIAFFTARHYIKTGKLTYSSPYRWMDIAMLAALILWWIVRNML